MTQGDAVPTGPETGDTVAWLGRRGIQVGTPTRLLAIRIGVRAERAFRGRLFGRFLLYTLAGAVCGAAFELAWGLADFAPGPQLVEGSTLWFILVGLQVALWHRTRGQERLIASRLPEHVTAPVPRDRLRLIGSWNWAAAVITFGGGTALCVVLLVTTPGAQSYGWSWLTLLVLSALYCAVALRSVLRSPVIAEDETSLAVDRRLWFDYLGVALPVIAVYPLIFDLLLGGGGLPRAFTRWQLGYVVLAIVIQTIGLVLQFRRLRIPRTGNYGVPAGAPGPQRAVDWSPPA